MAAIVFMPVDARPREMLAPYRRAVGERLGRNLGEDPVRYANIDQADFAAMHVSRQQQMTWLQTEERDGLRRLDRNSAHQSGRSVNTRGDVDGNDRLMGSPRPFVQAQNGVARRGRAVTIEACATHR